MDESLIRDTLICMQKEIIKVADLSESSEASDSITGAALFLLITAFLGVTGSLENSLYNQNISKKGKKKKRHRHMVHTCLPSQSNHSTHHEQFFS